MYQFSTALRLVTCYLPRSDFARPTPATKSKNFEVFSRRNSNDLSWFEMSDNLKSTGWAKSRGQTAQCFELKHWTLSTVYRLSLRLTSLVFFRYPSHGTNESHTRMTTPTDYYNTTPVDGIENTHHLTAIYPLLFLLLEWGAEMLSLSFVSSQNAVMKTKSRPPTPWWSTCTLLPFYLMFGSIYLQTLAVKTTCGNRELPCVGIVVRIGVRLQSLLFFFCICWGDCITIHLT